VELVIGGHANARHDVGHAWHRADADGVVGGKQRTFDGRWKQQGLSEDAYNKKVGAADEQYAKLLAVLVSVLKTPSPNASR
jgi:hypothetical protein